MSNNPTVVVASYLSSVTTIGHPKLALPSDPAWSRAVCAQHRGGDLCRWYCWPWDCMASGTAVEVIMCSSSVRKAVPSVSIWVFFPPPPQIWPFYTVEFWGNSQDLSPPKATHCLVLEGTLHSSLQQVPVAYCSFLAQLLLPFPKQKQLLPAFHIALFKW